MESKSSAWRCKKNQAIILNVLLLFTHDAKQKSNTSYSHTIL